MNAAGPAAGRPILHLLGSGGFYGAERMLLDHCLGTPGRHQVLFLQAPAELLARFRQAGVDCQLCPGLGPLLQQVKARRGERPLLNSHNFKGLLFGWLAATLWRLPLITTQHGFTPRSRKQRFYTWISLQLCRTRAVTGVVCVAQSIARLHVQAGVPACKLHVIPNGLPAPAGVARPADLPQEAAAHLHCASSAALDDAGVAENRTAIPQPATSGSPHRLAGYVGRLSSEKGPDLFLDALIPLCRRLPQLHAVMLGEGPERASLQARIDAAGLTERITLPGFQHDMPAWMQRLDALVISSRSEGTPMILLEAMQQGVPVVAFAVGGVPDVIEHGHNGLLAAPLAVEELGARLHALLQDPGQAGELIARARRTQRERHHLPTLARLWVRVYEGVTQEVFA